MLLEHGQEVALHIGRQTVDFTDAVSQIFCGQTSRVHLDLDGLCGHFPSRLPTLDSSTTVRVKTRGACAAKQSPSWLGSVAL